MLLAALMLISGVALAETTEEQVFEADPVIGTILEIREDGSMLLAEVENDSVQILVHMTDETVVEADWTLAAGDVVLVSYDGKMTKSLPAQITAAIVRSFSIEGFVQEVNEETNRVLIDGPEMGQVWATLPEGEQASDYDSKFVRIFTSGVMALSYPGQVQAITIYEVAMESGSISELGEDYFMINWGQTGLRVNFDERSKMPDDLVVGEQVQVFYSGIMARSLPGQVFAIAVARVATGD